MRIEELLNGKWGIVMDDGTEIEFNTHAEAWRALDRMRGEPVSRAEQVSDWISKQT